MKNRLLLIVAVIIATSCSKEQPWRIVSMPDFLNVDCYYPQKGWEESLSYILSSVKDEDIDFVTVAGDMVMGHWDSAAWNDRDSINKYSNIFYSAWKNRMAEHGFKYYVGIGDHEIGDNPWKTEKKMKAVKQYKKAFKDHFNMPLNGPKEMQGTAFWWRHKNALFISIDVFEESADYKELIRPGVTGAQLDWMNNVLKEESKGVDHIIVQGHAPALTPVRKWSSSGLTIVDGQDSELWQLMKRYGVDVYLCGEVHAVTCKERDGIMQIAHGGLIGYNSRTNYLVMEISEDKIDLEVKEIELTATGKHLIQTKKNRPLEQVGILDDKKGFYSIGKCCIDKSQGTKQFTNRTGYFLEKLESSNEIGYPIFHKTKDELKRLEELL